MRADRAKNIDKIAAAFVKNPLATTREAADMAGVSNATVSTLRPQVERILTKDPRIENLADSDLLIQELANEEIVSRFRNPEEKAKMRTTEIAQVAEKSHARYIVIKGRATDKDGALPELKGADDQTLLKYAGITKE